MSVSIVIPLYNKEQYIAQSIKSVLEQTYQDFELIIVDDGSTDNSVKEVEKFIDKRIHIVSQKNAGVSSARNKGIKESKYELIAFLDADDEWMPDHLSKLMMLKNNFPNCKVFATNYKIVDSEFNERFPVNTEMVGIDGLDGVIQHYFEAAVKTAPPLWSSAVAVTKDAIEKIGGFPFNVTTGEDLLTWARLACIYKVAYSKKVTAIYHFYTINEWLMNARKPDETDVVGISLENLLIDCIADRSYLERYISLWYRMRLHNFMKMGEKSNAGKELWKILRHTKTDYKSYVLFLLTLLPIWVRKFILHKRADHLKKMIPN